MSRKVIIILLSFASLIIICWAGVTLYLDKFLDLDTYKDQIIANVENSLQRKFSYAKGELSLRAGPSVTFSGVAIKEKTGDADFVTAEHITFRIALLPLLKKQIVLRKIILDHPVIRLSRDKSGMFNISDLLETKKEAVPLQTKGVQLTKGTITFTDQSIAAAVVTTLEETNLSVSQFTRGKHCDFNFSANVVDGKKRSVVTLTGDAKLAAADKPFSTTTVNAKAQVKGLNASHYWQYYSRYVPFRKILGLLDLDMTWKGMLTDFKSKGNVRISGLRFDYPQVFHTVLTPKDLHFAYDLDFTPRDISVNSINLTVDGLNVRGNCAIKDIGSGDPRIVAKAATSRFQLERFGGYVPYGIIVKDTADFIEQHIKGGIYQLDEGRLNGRVSQILHMERGENYNILSISAKVEKGILSYGPKVPTFNTIKGILEMRGKDFNLKQMSGNFGISPFTLEGKITDYPLNSPSGYPFTMIISPRQPEAAWLMGRERGNKLALLGESTLRLTGNGYTSGYNLAGEWNLTPAAYSYANLVSKPAGRSNTIIFRGSVNKQGANLTELQYHLQPLTLALAANYRFTGTTPLQLDIRTNQFSIEDAAVIIPAIRKYQPSGKVQGELHGKGEGNDLAGLRWGGNINFAGFAFKPFETMKAVSNISGAIRFQGDSLETSQLVSRVGSTTIYAKGTLHGFKNPILSLAFSSPNLDLTDLGFRAPKNPIRFDKVQGAITLKEETLQINSLSGLLNHSPITVKGTAGNIHNPKIDITITSPDLDLDNILALRELELDNKKDSARTVDMKASLQVTSGRIKDVPFKKLKATASYEGGILYLQLVEFFAFDGEVTGKARIDTSKSGTPIYQVSCNLDKVSAEKVAHALGIKKQEITGHLSLQGEITVKGRGSEEFKSTALGSVKLQIEDGSLRRFSVLSKIFSILNVSQLMKFQLPDMVTGGMPFNKITGAISVRDGIAATNDLFIDSDAINISAIGKLNLIKNELDVTIGVQPLQTVDKVVSHIPVVGWILTGKKKSLITTYFEAKGKVEDPTVTAVPVKSLAKGVFNIFKRVFQLPAKLFTDTGEVILGN
jgi:uncharacterized protein involved in outer membrane biogenesis